MKKTALVCENEKKLIGSGIPGQLPFVSVSGVVGLTAEGLRVRVVSFYFNSWKAINTRSKVHEFPPCVHSMRILLMLLEYRFERQRP